MLRPLLTRALVTVGAALMLNVAAAHAADLLELQGDPPVTLSGTAYYGLVYVDGELRLTGDTTINASSIYFGPDASIDTCYVAGSGDGQCVGGRSLTLNSSGPLTVATGIDLQSGKVAGPGGSLSLTGQTVAVGGEIDTGGDIGYPSGGVTITSAGAAATQEILAPGAAVSITAQGTTLIGSSIQTQGADTPNPTGGVAAMQSGGTVAINANEGEVDIDGPITTQGQSAPSSGGSGGSGAAVTIVGGNVHTESIQTSGGASSFPGSGPGASGAISITAGGELYTSGNLAAAGASGAGNSGAPGAPVTVKSGGAVALGGIAANGGPAAPGATISVTGTTVASGDLNASGGAGSLANRSGGGAANISVTAPQGGVLGSLLAVGGSSDGTQASSASAGAGGSITVSSSAGSVSVGRVEAEGGNQGFGPGANGGSITLDADDNLWVAGDVRTDGSSAGGQSSPTWSGGNAGPLDISAATGLLNVGGVVSAEGGAGSAAPVPNQLGGTGGAGAPITLFAQAIDLLASVSSQGGPGGGNGDYQGPGGPGGAITAYTDYPIYNNLRWVSADGGDGDPTGAAGNEVQEASPTSLRASRAGKISFKSNSPGATRYELLMVQPYGTTKVVAKSRRTTGLRPKTAVCQSVKLEVVAIVSGAHWTSAPSNVIKYERPASKGKTCTQIAKRRTAKVAIRS